MCSLSHPRPFWSCLCRAAHGASQNLKLPLHYAAAKGAPFEVMELLLDANREAAAAADKARGPANTAPPTPCRRRRAVCRCSPSSSRTDLVAPTRPMLRHTPRTQDEKLPLHYAAAKGAPLGVMKFLLDANPKALTATDKVSPLSPSLRPSCLHAMSLSLSPLFTAATLAVPRLPRPLRCAGPKAAAALRRGERRDIGGGEAAARKPGQRHHGHRSR